MANARHKAMMEQRRSNQKASLNKRQRKKEEKKRKKEKKKYESEGSDSSNEDTKPNRANRKGESLDETNQRLIPPPKNNGANDSAADSIEAELARLN